MFREKLAWIIGIGTGYSWFYLSFFCTPPSVRDLLLRARFLLTSVCRKNAINFACSTRHRCFFFPLLLSSVTRTTRSLHAFLRLTEKRWKIAPVLQIQAPLMKLRVYGFLFLVSFFFLSLHSLFARSCIFYHVSSCFCFCFWFFSVKMLPSTRCSETQKRWLTVIFLFHVFIVSCQVLFFLVYQRFKMFLFILSFSLTLNSFQCKVKYETAQVLLQGLEEEAHTDEDRRLLNKCILWSRFCRLVCAASTK